MRLIDADAVEAKIEKTLKRLVTNQNKPDLAAALIYVGDLICEAPTIEARPVVRGEWRRCYDDSAGWVDMCDQCGGFGDGTNFCPECGADMRGEEDGEE